MTASAVSASSETSASSAAGATTEANASSEPGAPPARRSLFALPSTWSPKSVARWQRRSRRVGYYGALTLVPMLLVAVITVLVVQVRLQHGPISLKFLTPPIERGINAELGDLKAEIGDLEASLSAEGRLEFHLKSVVIRDADGDVVASAPRAEVELAKEALWSLKAVPQRVYLVEPRIALRYSREAGLSLSFAGPDGAAGGVPAAPVRHAPLQGYLGTDPPPDAAQGQQLDLARLVAMNSARARRGEDATSYLRELGLRNARVSVDHDGKLSNWTVEEAALDLEHLKRRSIISGSARIASSAGPWRMNFRTEDSERTKKVSVRASVRDFVPSAAALSLANPGVLGLLDLPVAADAALELSTNGVLNTASLAIELGRGEIRLSGPSGGSLPIDAGLLHFDFDAAAKRGVLAPSMVKWGESSLSFSGEAAGPTDPSVPNNWTWNGKIIEGALATGEYGIASLPVENGTANGLFNPDSGSVTLNDLQIKAGDAQFALTGQLRTDGDVTSLLLNGATAPMPVSAVKAVWPRLLAPSARDWFGRSMTKGTIGAAELRLATGLYAATPSDGSAPAGPAGLSLTFEANALEAAPPGLGMTFDVPRALFRVSGETAEINVPDAGILSPSGKRIPLKGIRFQGTGIGGDQPMGELSLRAQTALQPVAEIVLKRSGQSLEAAMPVIQSIDGKADVTLTATAPLLEGAIQHEVRVSGKAKITDIRAKQKIGALELQGGTIDIDIKDMMATATGDLLVNGVLAKLAASRNLSPQADKQEPLKINARLDNSDRTQLGIDINHIVQGEVPFEVTVAFDDPSAPKVKVHGELADAEMTIRDLAWRKPRGKPGTIDFDVKKTDQGFIELQNFKVVSADIGIEGWLSIDAENEVREFYFPEFSLNVVSQLEVQGKLSPARIWSLKAKGKTFDASDLFTDLVSVSTNDENRIRPLRPSAGIDIEAEVDNVLGHNEVKLRNFKIKVSDRGDKLAALDAEGTLEGGKPLSIVLKREADLSRIVSVVTSDAGQASKLVGFYRSIERGRAQVEINLDAKGAADKSGNVWIEDFQVLGDPVVSEVVGNTPAPNSAGGALPKGRQKVVREKIDFNRLFARFSAGHRQLVIEDAAVKGPLLGATIRGKIDHGTARLSLGGTYIPLQGINAAFCSIPVVGQIISGTGCEGLLGITYAIQGPIEKPQVIVNPFSIVAPGIFREIFQMTTPNPRIQPRAAPAAASAAGTVGTSASPVTRGTGSSAPPPGRNDAVIDGWSMGTSNKRN